MNITTLLVNVLGFAATAVAICMWIPQARITWHNRNDAIRLAGVSETTQWLSAVSYLLWGLFGVLSDSFWVMAPSLVSFPLSLATIVVVRRGRRLPPVTNTIPIIPMSAPLSSAITTASIPILVAGTLASVGATVSAGAATSAGPFTLTGAIPVFA